ncbi:hypothetical protein POM88_051290 [Heracleum sosnowskyi]|uniref:Uncharacterized protein n=1 Tax=Heracleum sosnowskyi TaxID=360622 RepID=A0AAD8H1H4_9APIA|nr:hypothetical protein POM88_051290 [Heracleum sosnowskyi]
MKYELDVDHVFHWEGSRTTPVDKRKHKHSFVKVPGAKPSKISCAGTCQHTVYKNEEEVWFLLGPWLLNHGSKSMMLSGSIRSTTKFSYGTEKNPDFASLQKHILVCGLVCKSFYDFHSCEIVTSWICVIPPCYSLSNKINSGGEYMIFAVVLLIVIGFRLPKSILLNADSTDTEIQNLTKATISSSCTPLLLKVVLLWSEGLERRYRLQEEDEYIIPKVSSRKIPSTEPLVAATKILQVENYGKESIRSSCETRTCKVLPNIITKVRQVQDNVSIWCCPPLNGSQRHLCTSETEGKHISYSNKNLAQTKKEQCWCFDPTIKYEAVRKCAVPRYAYHDDCPSDWPDSSDSEILTETMTEEESQTQKDKILAEAKEEQPFSHDPRWNYDLLKQFFYLDSPDSLAYSNLILDSKTEEENKAKLDEYNSSTTQSRLIFVGSDLKTKTETETESEIETHKEQLFRYDPSIIYKPLKRYIVPRFGFYDSSSTDWSDSLDSSAFSDSETEIKTTEEEEAPSQEDKILAGSKDKQLFRHDFVNSTSTNLQSMAQDLAKSPSGHL